MQEGLDVPQLDEVQHLQRLQQSARQQFQRDTRVHTVALQLVAALFYWETYRVPVEKPDGSYLVEGRILCRLAPGSLELVEVGKLFRRKIQEGCRVQFVVKEQDVVAEQNDMYPLTMDLITRMIDDARFEMHIPIHISSKTAQTEVSLLFTRKDWFPISGFPRSLLPEERPRTRQAAQSSNRWAGGSIRSKQARDQWTTPDVANDSRLQKDTITDYASPSHGLFHSQPLMPSYQQHMPSPTDERRGVPGIRAAFRALLRPSRLAISPTVSHEMPGSVPQYGGEENPERAAYKRWISTLSSSGNDDFLSPSGTRPHVQTEVQELPANHVLPVELPVDEEHAAGFAAQRRRVSEERPLPYRTATEEEGLQELFPPALSRAF